MNRRGFTLAELLIATVVMGILGTALARMLVSDSRFVSSLDAKMSARLAARGAMNTMAIELRMISDGGLLGAAPDSVAARIPYAFGMLCNAAGAGTAVSLVPADSAMYDSALMAGLAYRDSTGLYQFVDSVTASGSSATSACTSDSVRVIPGGRLVETNTPIAAAPGTLVYLYQRITYRFASSVVSPGRQGLWRRIGSQSAVEIVAPFDTAAGFEFLVGTDLVPQATPPGDLETVLGLELKLVGSSEFIPRGQSDFETFDLRTTIPFLNRSQ